MSLVQRVKQAVRTRRLRRSLSRHPSPQAYSDLADLYIQKGNTEQAHRIAVEGLDLFPNAHRLREVSRFAKRQELQDRIRCLDETLRVHPHPATYTELASIYWEMGNHDRAEEACLECADAFPQNENPYLILGEIRLERFLDEGLQRDGRKAMVNLEKVAALNHNNVKCHLLLARMFHATGALTRCCSHLRAILSITPTARDIREFLTELERTIAAAEEEESIDSLLSEIQMTGQFRHDPAEFPAVKGARCVPRRSQLDLDVLRDGMSALARTPGVRRAIVLDGEGETLLESGEVADPSRSVFASLVKSVGKTAFDLSRRMDIGTLEKADIEGPFGDLRLVRMPGALCCVLGESPKAAAKGMNEFVARSFAARGAWDHA